MFSLTIMNVCAKISKKIKNVFVKLKDCFKLDKKNKAPSEEGASFSINALILN